MIKRITTLISKKTDKKHTDFFNLSLGEQKTVIKKALRTSCKEQGNLLKEYEKKFGK
ncbi:MAG: hypothetical protein PHI66_04820 [Candidatus Pacebacteria bacterium]|jgi:hypothetical protein|nr:hypothetical protein [Candidatus Paceibacterota bacterium]